MKKIWILILLTAVVFVSTGLTSCQKKEKPTGTQAAPAKQEEAKPAEKPAGEPAAEKPKDHPAH